MRSYHCTMAGDDNRGTTVVEFAILAPVFITLLIGAVGLGIALFLMGSLHYAVEEGARCASVKTGICTDAKAIIAYTQNRYFGPQGLPKFTYAAASCGNSVSASVNYTLNLGLTTITIPITASACFP